MSPDTTSKPRGGFRHFFFRGLAIVLPTALTIWLIVIAYQFVKEKIATPINSGLRLVVVYSSPWPTAEAEDFDEAFEKLPAARRQEWTTLSEAVQGSAAYKLEQRRKWMEENDRMVLAARREAMERWWQTPRIGTWQFMDLIGVVIAIVLIYFIGILLTSYFGRRLYKRGEDWVNRVPFIRRVYPSIKQVTDFFFPSDGEEKPPQFSRVVAVEYPRKGLWSVGLVTGTTMKYIQDKAGEACLTVFVPSSPTPFTGYVVTVRKSDTIDLPVTIEDALKFTVSGGVVVPTSQQVMGDPADLPPGLTTTKIDAPNGAPDSWT